MLLTAENKYLEGTMETRIIPVADAEQYREVFKSFLRSFGYRVMFTGSCWACASHACAGFYNGKLIGISTILISEKDETSLPSLLALAVSPTFRNRGFGKKIFDDSLEFLFRNTHEKIHIEILHEDLFRIISKTDRRVIRRLMMKDSTCSNMFKDMY